MFSKTQLEEIYKLFPHESIDDEIIRCENCFIRDCLDIEYFPEDIEIDEDIQFYSKDGKLVCGYCLENDPHETIIIRELLTEIYKFYGIEKLKIMIEVIDPTERVKNIYDKILIQVLDKPECVEELLQNGADTDMNFGDISGNSNYTLLGWCLSLQNNYRESAIILMETSKNKLIFRNKNYFGQNIFGSLVSGMLRDSVGYRYVYKELLLLIISKGAYPQLESMNEMGISGIQYEDRPHNRNVIDWLIELEVSFDLEKCVKPSCSRENCSEEKCGVKLLLKNTRLGRYLLNIK